MGLGGLRFVGVAALLLGLYHLVLQQLSSTSAAEPLSGKVRPCRTTASRFAVVADSSEPATAAEESTASMAKSEVNAGVVGWRPPPWSNLEPNTPASTLLASVDASKTTLHFTFGSISMMDFLRNWRHFVQRAGLAPAIVGAADGQMLAACTAEGIAAIGLVAGLDVWNYTRSSVAVTTVVQSGKSEWKYYRHHKSSFLELGLVKAAFLWELLRLGYDILISDLDVVWLDSGWHRWASPQWGHAPAPCTRIAHRGCHAPCTHAQVDELPARSRGSSAAPRGGAPGDGGRARVDGRARRAI